VGAGVVAKGNIQGGGAASAGGSGGSSSSSSSSSSSDPVMTTVTTEFSVGKAGVRAGAERAARGICYPQSASEYAKDILHHCNLEYSKYQPTTTFMDRQTDIDEGMRAILIDWIIVDVHLKFKLEDEVLYLTVHLIDRAI
jgi:hypothetical protein